MRIISHEWRILSEEIGCFVLDVHDRLTVRLAVEKRGEDYLSVCCLPTQTKIARQGDVRDDVRQSESRRAVGTLRSAGGGVPDGRDPKTHGCRGPRATLRDVGLS